MKARALVLEHRGELVYQRRGQLLRQTTERLLLHHGLSEPHVDAAFDLPECENRVERTADIVRDPDLVDGIHAGFRVNLDFQDRR